MAANDIAKKTRPEKKSLKGNNSSKSENRAAAWMNMTIPLKDGESEWKMRKGYAIFDSEQYPDHDGMKLAALAEKNGGEITVPMMVTIRVNKPNENMDLENIPFT